MTGYVDLHCHWVWQIDDGARSEEEGLQMLKLLGEAGFSHVVATPHMRPGMFDNAPDDLSAAYERALGVVAVTENLPGTSLGSEHFFDATVMERVREGFGFPYRDSPEVSASPRSRGAILVEFADLAPLTIIEHQLFELQKDGFIPVIAHPERYRSVWSDPSAVRRLVDLGSVALLDVAALVGKYGSRAKDAAWDLLDDGVYDAACTDSHRPGDVGVACEGMRALAKEYGEDELAFLFTDGPRALLHGERPPTS